MAELADAPGLGPGVLRGLRVRIPPLAPDRRRRGDSALPLALAACPPPLPLRRNTPLLPLLLELGDDVGRGRVHDVLGLVEQRRDVGALGLRLGRRAPTSPGSRTASRRRIAAARSSGSRPGTATGPPGRGPAGTSGRSPRSGRSGSRSGGSPSAWAFRTFSQNQRRGLPDHPAATEPLKPGRAARPIEPRSSPATWRQSVSAARSGAVSRPRRALGRRDLHPRRHRDHHLREPDRRGAGRPAPRATLVGRNALDLVHPDDRSRALEALNRTVAGGPGRARPVLRPGPPRRRPLAPGRARRQQPHRRRRRRAGSS